MLEYFLLNVKISETINICLIPLLAEASCTRSIEIDLRKNFLPSNENLDL